LDMSEHWEELFLVPTGHTVRPKGLKGKITGNHLIVPDDISKS